MQSISKAFRGLLPSLLIALVATVAFSYAVPTSASAAMGDAPELPRESVDTSLPNMDGDIIRVNAGDDLQRAIDEAQPGDTILLEAGATFTGSFDIPEKNNPNNEWIVIKTDGDIPEEGERVTPDSASDFARIMNKDTIESPLIFERGASHWRIIGVEVTTDTSRSSSHTHVVMRTGSSHIVIDRSYVHGHGNLGVRRCILLHSEYGAVIDSWISECHIDGFDSQAILAYNTPGPLKIVNNYLEGAGENVMFGGADPQDAAHVPSDITVRGNYIRKPASWFDSGEWTIKNLFEIKTANRVLFEGNVLDGSWADAQGGGAILIKSVNQSGGEKGSWSSATDITIINNVVRNAGSFLSAAAAPEGPVAEVLSRVEVSNNYAYQMGYESDYSTSGWRPRAMLILSDVKDISIENNTLLGRWANQLIMEGDGKENIVFRNNVVDRADYGVREAWLESNVTGYDWSNNVWGPASSGWRDWPAEDCAVDEVLPVPSECTGAGHNVAQLEKVLEEVVSGTHDYDVVTPPSNNNDQEDQTNDEEEDTTAEDEDREEQADEEEDTDNDDEQNEEEEEDNSNNINRASGNILEPRGEGDFGRGGSGGILDSRDDMDEGDDDSTVDEDSDSSVRGVVLSQLPYTGAGSTGVLMFFTLVLLSIVGGIGYVVVMYSRRRKVEAGIPSDHRG